MKLAICDTDEKNRSLLEKFCKEELDDDAIQVDTFSSGMELIDDISWHGVYDICVVRADMNGVDGYEVLEETRQYRQECATLLYTIESPEAGVHAVEAWRRGADGFFLLSGRKDPLDQVRRSMKEIRNADNMVLRLKLKDGWYHLRCREITDIESSGHKVLIHSTDGSELEAYGKLDAFEEELKTTGRFLRIHKSTLVNASHIYRVSAAEVELEDGQVFTVSRSQQQILKAQYEAYLNSHFGDNIVTVSDQ